MTETVVWKINGGLYNGKMTIIIKAVDMGLQFLTHGGNHEKRLQWHPTDILSSILLPSHAIYQAYPCS